MRPAPLRLFLPAALIAALIATLPGPAAAEPMGAVGQLVLGHALFAEGEASRDGLSLIAGARLAGGVKIGIVDREKETTGPATEDAAAAAAPRNAAQLMAIARTAVEADEALSFLLIATESLLEVLPRAEARASAAQIGPGQSQIWRLPADGGAALDVGVVDDGGSVLRLRVTAVPPPSDTAPAPDVLCSATALPLCRIVLPDSGFVDVTVQNAGTEAENYLLVSN